MRNYLVDKFKKMKKNKSVLLLDGNKIDLFVNQKIFEFHGIINVHSFSNPIEALCHLKNTDIRYSIIIIDIFLPIINGFDFIDKFYYLKLDKKHGEICLLSASINPLDKDHASERKVRLIEKPLNINELFIGK